MKVIVFSDSHGSVDYMLRAIEKEHPDAIFHLGDHAEDGEQLEHAFPTLSSLIVRGNCDYLTHQPPIIVTSIQGVRLYLCHGHTLGVKYSLLRAELAAREEEAKVLLYGHTHVPHLEETPSGLLMINPGSYQNRGYAILNLQDGFARAELKEYRQR